MLVFATETHVETLIRTLTEQTGPECANSLQLQCFSHDLNLFVLGAAQHTIDFAKSALQDNFGIFVHLVCGECLVVILWRACDLLNSKSQINEIC